MRGVVRRDGSVAERVVDALVAAGADFCASVPCNTLGPLLHLLSVSPHVRHVPVTREEEGVGLCAGAALAGRLPILVMQNSGLGNVVNALLSCSQFYRLPLLLLVSYRGGPDETIDAQRPMGEAMRGILAAIDVRYQELERPSDASRLPELLARAATGRVVAAIVHPAFWTGQP